jgi:hypothetical protein
MHQGAGPALFALRPGFELALPGIEQHGIVDPEVAAHRMDCGPCAQQQCGKQPAAGGLAHSRRYLSQPRRPKYHIGTAALAIISTTT